MKRFYFIFFLFIQLSTLVGQERYRNTIRSMFDNTQSGLWIKYYEGVFDESFPVKIILGISGEECRGVIIYKGKDQKFTLDGTIVDEVYYLEEYDQEQQHTANIVLTLKDYRLMGEWNGIRSQKKYALNLKRTNSKKEEKLSCTSPFFIKYYQDEKNDVKVEAHHSVHHLEIKLLIAGNVVNWIDYKEERLEKELQFNKKGISYILTPLKEDELMLKINDGYKIENFHLDLEKEIPFKCHLTTGFSSKGEVHFPKVDKGNFNVWMKDKMERIWKESIKHLVDNSSSPYDRFEKDIFIQTKVHHFNKQLLSGLILVENKALNEVETIAFTFDFNKDQELVVEKVFKKNKKTQTIQKFVNKAYLKLSNMKEGIEKDWLLANKFEHIIFGDKGMDLYSSYNMIYGNKFIHIPYNEIKNQLKYIPN